MKGAFYKYVGSELELFSGALNWKHYWSSKIRRFIGRRILEVGAGIGGTTYVLSGEEHDSWVCLEPDAQLASELQSKTNSGDLPKTCEVRVGTIEEIPRDSRFDTILYVDVLEHIENDRGELERAAVLLADGGYLVVVAPAHQWLFSAFDEAVGHFRRYNREQLRRRTPPGTVTVASLYLDSAGLFASLANRFLLRSDVPTVRQIAVWDSMLVRISRFVDPILGCRVGKTVVQVWRRE